MVIAALEGHTEAEADSDEAAIPVHLDPKLAPRRRDATSRFRLLTPEQQATYMLREMPAGLRRAPAIEWASVPTKAAIYLFFGRGLQDPCRWQLLLGAGVLGTDGLEPATIVVAVACAKGVPGVGSWHRCAGSPDFGRSAHARKDDNDGSTRAAALKGPRFGRGWRGC